MGDRRHTTGHTTRTYGGYLLLQTAVKKVTDAQSTIYVHTPARTPRRCSDGVVSSLPAPVQEARKEEGGALVPFVVTQR